MGFCRISIKGPDMVNHFLAGGEGCLDDIFFGDTHTLEADGHYCMPDSVVASYGVIGAESCRAFPHSDTVPKELLDEPCLELVLSFDSAKVLSTHHPMLEGVVHGVPGQVFGKLLEVGFEQHYGSEFVDHVTLAAFEEHHINAVFLELLKQRDRPVHHDVGFGELVTENALGLREDRILPDKRVNVVIKQR